MIGRGAQGAPWKLAQVAAEIYGTDAPEIPTGAALVDLVCAHYQDMLGFYGETLGSRVARKHLGWYMDGTGCNAALRKAVLTERTPATVLKLLPDALSQQSGAA